MAMEDKNTTDKDLTMLNIFKIKDSFKQFFKVAKKLKELSLQKA